MLHTGPLRRILKSQCHTICTIFKLSYELTLCQANLLEAEFQLKGSDAYAARFGQTIADLGDLDDDGYPGKGAHASLLPLLSC